MLELLTAYALAVTEPIQEVDEDELLSAAQRGALSSTSLDAWLEVLRDGIDVQHTTREELSNVPGLTESDLDSILEGRELDGSQRAHLRPFLKPESTARLRLITGFASGDTFAPPAVFDARVQGPFNLTAGALLTSTRRLIDTPRINAGRLETAGFGYHLHLPRLFVEWRHERLRLIVGTFTAGFAERLTLDTTRRLTPSGFALSDDFRRPSDLSRSCKLSPADASDAACPEGRSLYVTPDFDVREVFRGVAVSLDAHPLGERRSLGLFGFASFQSRSVYQYELVDGEAAPHIYLEGSDTRVVFSTLPYFYDELAGGGHAQVDLNEHIRLGITGYLAAPFISDDAPTITFQPWSRHPPSGLFGALGLDAHARAGELFFHLEATRSFDASTQGGGFGVIERTTWRELELSLRYYDTGFANPYARPVSAPDEYDGQRARNELGARLTAQRQVTLDWRFFTRVDFWVLPFSNPRVGPAGMANLFAHAQLDFTRFKALRPGVTLETRNRNLASSTHGRCASGTAVFTEGEPFDCSGDLYRVGLRLESPTLGLTAQSTLTLADDARYPTAFRIDFQQWLEAHGQPATWLQWRARTRYLNQDVDDNTYLEHSWWSFIELAWLPKDGTRLAARYDLVVWLDQRPSTLARIPNPEHRFSLDLRTTF